MYVNTDEREATEKKARNQKGKAVFVETHSEDCWERFGCATPGFDNECKKVTFALSRILSLDPFFTHLFYPFGSDYPSYLHSLITTIFFLVIKLFIF